MSTSLLRSLQPPQRGAGGRARDRSSNVARSKIDLSAGHPSRRSAARGTTRAISYRLPRAFPLPRKRRHHPEGMIRSRAPIRTDARSDPRSDRLRPAPPIRSAATRNGAPMHGTRRYLAGCRGRSASSETPTPPPRDDAFAPAPMGCLIRLGPIRSAATRRGSQSPWRGRGRGAFRGRRAGDSATRFRRWSLRDPDGCDSISGRGCDSILERATVRHHIHQGGERRRGVPAWRTITWPDFPPAS